MKYASSLLPWIMLLLAAGWVMSNFSNEGHPPTHSAPLNLMVYAIKAVLWLAAGALVYEVFRQNFHKFRFNSRDLKKRIDGIGERYVGSRPNVALVIAFYQNGSAYCKGFGKISETDPRPPDTRTIFEIGSITKVFTGVALAKMMYDGSLALGDPLSRFLPEGVQSPKFDGREITLKDLATHTSGLPRLPDNFKKCVKNQLDPYVDYTTQDLYDDLASVKLRWAPGRLNSYSNYGFGLLGKILELRSGKTYEALVQESICAPLGLANTTTCLSEEQRKFLAPGHNVKGKVVPNWGGDTLAGCGRLYSNAEDLLKFIQANLADSDSQISRALQLARKVHFRSFARDIGLGWQIEKESLGGPVLCWHNGGTGGYVSFCGFDPEHQIGVVVLSSYGGALVRDNSTDQIGMNLLRLGEKISLA